MDYIRETTQILGKTLNHDDSVNDRAVGSKLSNASQTTSKLWKETFGEDFRNPGRFASTLYTMCVYNEFEMTE